MGSNTITILVVVLVILIFLTVAGFISFSH